MKQITLHFTTEDDLQVTLQGDDFDKIKEAIGDYDPKGITVNKPEFVSPNDLKPGNNGKPVTK